MINFGGQVGAIGEFLEGIIVPVFKLAVIVAIVSIPVAAIKYLFWG